MDMMIKCAGAALLSTVMCLLLKRTNPEISVLLSAAAVTVIMLCAMGFARGIQDLAAMVKTIVGSSEMLIAPVLKCVGIAAITKITTELCKDASQSALAAAVDMAGTLCAVGVAMPLVISMLKMIGGMT